jgi:hypothetical protein
MLASAREFAGKRLTLRADRGSECPEADNNPQSSYGASRREDRHAHALASRGDIVEVGLDCKPNSANAPQLKRSAPY